MTIREELLAFRQRIPGCRVIAFADLSTGMVLASSTSEKTTQEKLDALCAAGLKTLMGEMAHVVHEQFGRGAGASSRVAVNATLVGTRCFVRARPPAQEALCLVMDPKTPLAPLLSAALALVDQLAGEGEQ